MRLKSSGRSVVSGSVVGLGVGRSVWLGGGLIALLSMSAMAGPEGERVAAGSATFARDGLNTTITASNNSIINYTGFDVGARESVTFVQPSSAARVLNRIQSVSPTRIDGSISANGRVYFANPAGMIFGPTSVIDVGAIYAAAANISNRDFLSGIDAFTDARGEVRNYGAINAGEAHLIGKFVGNYGTIVADEGGIVTMTSGEDVYVGKIRDNWMVRVRNPASASRRGPARGGEGAGVVNAGSIDAPDGSAMLISGDLAGLAIMQDVVASIHAADIRIEAHARGDVSVSGTLDASSADAVGGSVRIVGERIAVDSATIDASGAIGGGRVLIGGAYQGKGDVRRADRTFVSVDSVVSADATQQGDGGEIVVWSDERTGFFGSASARGGASGGDGGLIETSGKLGLSVSGARVSASAERGRAGLWLLDPTDVTVSSAATSGTIQNVGGVFDDDGSNANTANINAADIVASLEGGTSVVVRTASGGAGPAGGSITVDPTGTISPNLSSDAGEQDVTLTFDADSFITVNAPITTSGGDANDSFGVIFDAVGAVDINSPITTLGGGVFTSSGTTFDNTGGAISAGAGAVTVTHTGAVTVGETISGGAISMTGVGGFDVDDAVTSTGANDTLIFADDANLVVNAAINSATGNVTVRADGNITFTAAGAVSSTSGAVVLTPDFDGVGAPFGTIIMADGSSVNAGSGDITVTGVEDATISRLTTTSNTATAVSVLISGGAITDAGAMGGADVQTGATGTATLSASDHIGSGNAIETQVGTLTASAAGAGGVTIFNTGSLTTNLTAGAGTATVAATGAITLGTSNVSALVVDAQGGNLTDSGTTTVAGTASLTTSQADADINTDQLAVTGAITLSTAGTTGNATIQNTGTAVLGASTVNGTLTVTAPDINIGAAVAATNAVLQPVNNGDAISLGGASAFNLTNADLGNLDSAGTVTIGRAAGTHAFTINNTGGAIDLGSGGSAETYDLTLRGGSVAFSAGMTTADNQTVTITTTGVITGSGGTDVTAAGGTLAAQAGGALNIDTAVANLGGTTGSSITIDNGNNSLTLTGAVVSTGAIDIAAGTATLTTGGGANVSAGVGQTVTLTADSMAIGSTITGNGGVTLQPSTVNRAINLNNGAGALDLSQAELSGLASTGTVTIGRAGGTGAIGIGSDGAIDLSTESFGLALRGGATTFNDSLTLADNTTLTFVTGAITGSGSTDVVIGGGTGTVAFTSSGGVDLDTAVGRLGASTAAGSIDIDNGNTALTVTGAVASGGVLGDDISLSTGTAGFSSNAGGTIDAGAADVTLTGNAMAIGDTITGSFVTIQPGAAATTIAVNDATGAMSLSLAELQLLVADNVIVGRLDQDGDVNVASLGAIDLSAQGYILQLLGGDIIFNTAANNGITLDSAAILNLVGDSVSRAGGANRDVIITGGAGFLTINAGAGAATLRTTIDNLDAVQALGGFSLDNSGNPLDVMGAVTAGVNPVSITASALSINDTITGGDITLQADAIAIGSAVTGTDITLAPVTPGTTIAVNDATGDFSVTEAELQLLDATGRVTIGAADSGALNAASLGDIDLSGETFDLSLIAASITFNTGANDGLIVHDDGAVWLTTAAGGVARAGAGATTDVTIGGTTGSLSVEATGGAIGAAGAEITAAVDRFAATTDTGGVFLTNTGGLEIAALTDALGGALDGVTSGAGGDITITTASPLTVNEAVTSSGAGNITLTAGGGATGDLAVNAAVSTGSGVVALNATNDLSFSAGGSVTTTTGNVNLTADADFSGDGGVTMADGSSVISTSGQIAVVSEDGVQLSRLATGNTTANAVAVTSNSGPITDGGDAGGADVQTGPGGAATLAAAAGAIGSGNAIETQVSALTATAGGAGGINIANSGDLTATLTANNGPAVLSNTGMLATGGAWSADSFDIDATGAITVNHDVTSDQAAGTDFSSGGAFTVATGVTVATGGNPLNIIASDLALNGTGALDAGAGDAIIRRNAAGSIGLGAAAGDMSISNAELTNITANDLTIGGTNTNLITADGVSGATNVAGTVFLRATADGGDISFVNAASSFPALDAAADDLINVAANLTATAGGIVLAADADSAADMDDRIDLGANLTAADGVTLSAATNGIMATDNRVIDADSDDNNTGTFTVLHAFASAGDVSVFAADIAIADMFTADDVTIARSTNGTIGIGAAAGGMTIDNTELGNLVAATLSIGGTTATSITADGASAPGVTGLTTLFAGGPAGTATFSGGASSFAELSVFATDGILVNASVTATTGDLTLDADFNDDGTGPLTVGPGATAASTAGDVSVTASDLFLSGNLAAGGAAGITRSTAGSIGLGDVGDMAISGAELSRIAAMTLTLGGGPTTDIAVGPITGVQSAGITGLTTLDAGGGISFTGDSTFAALTAMADDGVAVGANITTTSGALTLNGDADSAADTSDDVALAAGVTLDSADALTLSALTGGISTAGAATLRAADGVTLAHATAAGGALTVNADTDADGDGTFTVSAGGLATSGADVGVTAADVALDGALNAGAGDVSFMRATGGTIGIGDALGDMRISRAELAMITADDLNIGGASTTGITVDHVEVGDSAGITGTVTLAALANGGGILFENAAANFSALTANADDGIAINAGVNSTIGSLAFNGNADAAADADDGVAIGGDVAITSAANLTIGGAASPVLLSGGAGTGVMLSARGDLTLANTTVSNNSSLSASAGGSAALGTVDLGSGDLSVTVDDDGDTAGATLDIAAASANDVALSGGTDGDDTINISGDQSAGGSFAANNAGNVAFATDADITSTGGIDISTGVAMITLDGADDSAHDFIAGGDLALAPVVATNNADFNVAAGGMVTMSSVDLNNGDLAVTVDSDDDGAETGIFGALSGGSVTLNGAGGDDVLLLGGDVTATTGSAAFNGPVSLTGNVIVAAPAGGVTFGDAVDGGFLLTTNSGASGVQFDGIVGGATPLAGLVVNSGGSAGFAMPVTVGGQGIAVTTAGALDLATTFTTTAGGDFTVTNGGLLRILPGAAFSLAGGFTQNGAGAVMLGADVSAGDDVLFGSGITLISDLTIAGNDVTFSSTVSSDAMARNMVVNTSGGGVTTFAAAVGAEAAPLGSLTTNADGSTRIGGDVFTSDTMTFMDAVVLTGDATFTDTGDRGIFFHSTINSDGTPRALTLLVNPDPLGANGVDPAIIGFGGNVGLVSPLRELSLNTIDGSGRRVETPPVATIVGGQIREDNSFITPGEDGFDEDFSLTFTVTDLFQAGFRERITIFGDGVIEGGSNVMVIRLPDFTTAGDMTVSGDSIILLRRAPASILTSDGVLGVDAGTDYVAGGDSIAFSVSPTVEGTGAEPTFGNPGGLGDVNGTLGGFVFRSFAGFDAGLLADPVGRALDLQSSGPTNTNISTILAGAVPRSEEAGDVEQGATVGQALKEQLKQIGITPRDLTTEELITFLAGRSLYNDYPSAADPGLTDYQVAVNRLPTEPVLEVIALYNQIFKRPVLDENGVQVVDESGNPVYEDRTREIKAVLEASIERYIEETGELDIDPVAFRGYLQSAPAEGEALAQVQSLEELLGRLRLLGLGPMELTIAENALLKDVQPEGMSLDEFKAVIQGVPDAPAPGAADEEAADPAQ